MSFTDVLVGAGVGFLLGGPAGAAAGGFAAIEAEGQVDGTSTAIKPSATSLTTATVGTKPAATEPTFFQQLGAVLGGGALAGVTGALKPAVTTAVTAGGKVVTTGCPSGKNRVRTVIQTLNPAGQVIKQKIEQGHPFLMNRDIVIAKRVFRTVAKVAGRLPKRTVKQSAGSQLKDAAIDKALRDVLTDNGHHHNGNGS